MTNDQLNAAQIGLSDALASLPADHEHYAMTQDAHREIFQQGIAAGAFTPRGLLHQMAQPTEGPTKVRAKKKAKTPTKKKP